MTNPKESQAQGERLSKARERCRAGDVQGSLELVLELLEHWDIAPEEPAPEE